MKPKPPTVVHVLIFLISIIIDFIGNQSELLSLITKKKSPTKNHKIWYMIRYHLNYYSGNARDLEQSSTKTAKMEAIFVTWELS